MVNVRISIGDFQRMNEAGKTAVLKNLHKKIGVKGISKAWSLSQDEVLSMLYSLKILKERKKSKSKNNPGDKKNVNNTDPFQLDLEVEGDINTISNTLNVFLDPMRESNTVHKMVVVLREVSDYPPRDSNLT